MANEIKKCPMCGTKLKMIDGKMTCKECGYYVRNQNAEAGTQANPSYDPGRPDAQTGTSGQNGNTYPNGNRYQAGTPGQNGGAYPNGNQYQTGNAGQNGNTYPNGNQYQTGNAGQTGNRYQAVPSQVPKPQQGSGVHPAVIIVPLAVFGVLLGVLFICAIFFIDTGFRPDAGTQAQASSGSKRLDDNPPPSSVTDDLRLPRSDFFRSIAEYIWEKDYRNITAEEYASLTAIRINKEEKTIEYYLYDDQDYQSLSYKSDYGMDLGDLASFTGLEWISIDDDLEKGDLDGLDFLYGVHTENTIKEYLEIIPHPENIVDLTVEDDFLERSLSGLEQFPSLEYLYVNYSYVEDISVLSQFPGLVELTLSDCNRVTDFSPLMSLTGLEELSIESDNMKSIDFIKNMPNLKSLSIEASQLSSLDALGSCPGLNYLYLYLDDNYSIRDYSIISGMENLSELVLEMGFSFDPDAVPLSFEKLTQLEYLSLKNAKDLSSLKDATGLTYLSLENCSGWELEAITSLQELTVLSIFDFSSYVDSLEPLTRLPKLAALNLEGTSVFGDIEEIFGIPTLQYLYLDDCQVGLNFDKLPDNESLTTLSLDDITILKDPTYNNGDAVSLSDHYDMFDHFPNLDSLYLASLDLYNIDFVEKLPNLQYLDITDNNVTSLKPLENLSHFEVVWCGKNTILENVSEDSGIWVIMED